ncbi:toxin RelE [Vreelandella sulfidaeris]|uniref:Toxin RelE n=1 Tax=Vreelandella sulfidaeris TaxID=115553 RepID=A0A455UGV0_9GAMM|nr:toxin RelE [Halomonas sulfidaeris]
MQTIVELPEFIKRASSLLKDEEKMSIVNYLAFHPQAGDIVQGTGGIRKLRWSAQGKGKSGGVRVIYYYHNGSVPLFLLTVFGKGRESEHLKVRT